MGATLPNFNHDLLAEQAADQVYTLLWERWIMSGAEPERDWEELFECADLAEVLRVLSYVRGEYRADDRLIVTDWSGKPLLDIEGNAPEPEPARFLPRMGQR